MRSISLMKWKLLVSGHPPNAKKVSGTGHTVVWLLPRNKYVGLTWHHKGVLISKLIDPFVWSPIIARCSVPIGLEDKRLPNGAMTASSYYNRYLAPWHGRINHRWSWSARRSTRTQWLQVYFGGLARITGISSQGRQDANQWVKTFMLTFSRDGIRFAKYPKVW